MKETDLERFLNSTDSRHRVVIIAAKRARQLQQGLGQFFEGKSTKVTTMALEELVTGKIEMVLPSNDTSDPVPEEPTTAPESTPES